MTTIHDTAPRFAAVEIYPDLTCRFEQVIQAIRSASAAMWVFCDALFGGFAAFRQFEHQKSWGVPQDAALRPSCYNQA
jgi:hypothetical protein